MPKKTGVLELSVCIGSSCHIKGAYNVIQTFQQLIEEHRLHDKIDFKSSFCMKQCRQSGVAVHINGEEHQVSPESAAGFFAARVMGHE
ncbi:MAG: (2Fe-2S) ferredoxin domain-containing protein [Treponema sp.]|jgi:NADH:ubiquinone oxidoreductase subunit E|nr:(2Fe-2S) ferredoxin domain-containing protein [Treponema sp.]